MDILGKLFGSSARVKIMRLFLLNPLTPFDTTQISEKSKTKKEVTKKETVLLEQVGLIQKKPFFKEIPLSKESKKTKNSGFPAIY